jgi:hypothetical protein
MLRRRLGDRMWGIEERFNEKELGSNWFREGILVTA